MEEEAVGNILDRWESINGEEDSGCMRKEGKNDMVKGRGERGGAERNLSEGYGEVTPKGHRSIQS